MKRFFIVIGSSDEGSDFDVRETNRENLVDEIRTMKERFSIHNIDVYEYTHRSSALDWLSE